MQAETFPAGRGPVLLRALVTVLIFTAIFWFLPIREVWHAMVQVGWWKWLMVLVAFAAGHLIAAFKWGRLVRATGQPLRYGDAIAAHMAGLFANIWLPSIVGGDVVRAAWISRSHGIAVPVAIGLLDRVLDLLALLMLAACGTFFIAGPAAELPTHILRGVGMALLMGIVIGLLVLRWLQPRRLPERLRPFGLRLVEIGKALYARPGPAVGSFMLALLVQFGFVGLNWYLGDAIGIAVPFAVWLVAWPLAKVVALLPVSLGGLGVREASLAALLAPFAVTGTLAIAEALVWQSILFCFGLFAGVLTLSTVDKGRPAKSSNARESTTLE